MNTREAFKIGFLEKCAADGLSPDETLVRIQHANFMLKTAENPLSSAMQLAWRSAWPLLLLGPPAAGLAGGMALARAHDDGYESGEARKREEIGEYQRAVERLQRLRERQAAMRG